MESIICTKNARFRFRQWDWHEIKKLYGGIGVVMALYRNGEVHTLTESNNIDCHTSHWRNIADLAISNLVPGAAIGLKRDGTCISSVGHTYGVHTLCDIIEVAASDAFFALDKYGKVHCIPLKGMHPDYSAVASWKNIAHIAVGNQDAVFGITYDGKVVCAGANCENGPMGNMNDLLKDVGNIAAICVQGAESGRVILFDKDGNIFPLGGEKYDMKYSGAKRISSNYCFTALQTPDDKLDFITYYYPDEKELNIFRNIQPYSFAAGLSLENQPFLVVLKEYQLFDIFRRPYKR